MAIGVLAADGRHTSSVRGRSRWALAVRWFVWLAVMTLIGVSTVRVAESEVRANASSERAHQTLEGTETQIRLATSRLTAVRSALAVTEEQVGTDSDSLARDTQELNAARGALADVRAHVSQQSETIDDLHLCLGGIERALNALSVDDQADAIAALDAVSSSCEGASGSDD